MKFDQFMYYYKRKFFIKNFYEKCRLETSPRSFPIYQESSEEVWRGVQAGLNKTW